MVFAAPKAIHVQFHNYFLLSIFLLLNLIIPNVSSLAFNFTSFDPNEKTIIYEGSANPESLAIQLTRNYGSIGRATNIYGDGMAFFLAPYGSKMPNATKGRSMGLTLDDQAMNSTVTNPFVAVEFDIYYKNPWDPPHEHAGIDINSMISVANVTWLADIKEGKLNEAWVSYNASSLNLSVVFTGFDNVTSTIVHQHLSSIVDLRLYLPEFVTIGFSAATGNDTAIHTLNSWDFSSNLEAEQDKKSKTGIALGLGVGGFVLIGVFGFISVCLWNKSKRGSEKEDGEFQQYIGEDFGSGGPKKYTYAELAHAANNFKDEHKLGQGGFGGVYRGFLKDIKSYVAIKRVSEDSHQGIKEFASEVTIISKLRHRNLVQLIEIACGRKPIIKAQENEINIVEWVWGLYGSGRILEAVDPRLGEDFEEEQIKCLMIVGLWCTHPDPNNRPSIRQATQVLNFEATLPNLPSSMPIPTYLEGPLNSFTIPSTINGSEEGQNMNTVSLISSNTNSSEVTTSDDDSSSESVLYSR
ncbi:hypothetical protein P8452_33276 [Trifolium repens]|nr:hypothetical protein P8452_33276 [Trifolium repens]